MKRRSFLKSVAGAIAGLTALLGVSKAKELTSQDPETFDGFAVREANKVGFVKLDEGLATHNTQSFLILQCERDNIINTVLMAIRECESDGFFIIDVRCSTFIYNNIVAYKQTLIKRNGCFLIKCEFFRRNFFRVEGIKMNKVN